MQVATCKKKERRLAETCFGYAVLTFYVFTLRVRITSAHQAAKCVLKLLYMALLALSKSQMAVAQHGASLAF